MATAKKTTSQKAKVKNLPATKNPTGGKQKSWNPANFRSKVGGLPNG
jgi:hypothetical protein